LYSITRGKYLNAPKVRPEGLGSEVYEAYKKMVDSKVGDIGGIRWSYPLWKRLKLEFCFYFSYSFIHMCIHCMGHVSPPPGPSLLPSPPLPSLPGRTCSALFSNFVEEKT
jgi:hypothetical protein